MRHAGLGWGGLAHETNGDAEQSASFLSQSANSHAFPVRIPMQCTLHHGWATAPQNEQGGANRASTRASASARMGSVWQCWQGTWRREGRRQRAAATLGALQRPKGRSGCADASAPCNGATICVAPARHLVVSVVPADSASADRAGWLRPLARCDGYDSRRYSEATESTRQR